MAKKAPHTGPTREQLTDEEFACYCRAMDILYAVAKRLRAKKELATREVQSEGGIDYDLC